MPHIYAIYAPGIPCVFSMATFIMYMCYIIIYTWILETCCNVSISISIASKFIQRWFTYIHQFYNINWTNGKAVAANLSLIKHTIVDYSNYYLNWKTEQVAEINCYFREFNMHIVYVSQFIGFVIHGALFFSQPLQVFFCSILITFVGCYCIVGQSNKQLICNEGNSTVIAIYRLSFII